MKGSHIPEDEEPSLSKKGKIFVLLALLGVVGALALIGLITNGYIP